MQNNNNKKKKPVFSCNILCNAKLLIRFSLNNKYLLQSFFCFVLNRIIVILSFYHSNITIYCHIALSSRFLPYQM